MIKAEALAQSHPSQEKVFLTDDQGHRLPARLGHWWALPKSLCTPLDSVAPPKGARSDWI